MGNAQQIDGIQVAKNAPQRAVCGVCPHHCRIGEGGTGLCRARGNRGGEIVCLNYGLITAMALDPIEKKPLRHYCPGSLILSVGSFGCNLRCPFCQNSSISMADRAGSDTVEVPPSALVKRALDLIPRGNIGIAYTYNEPLVGYEYVRDCARLAAEQGLKNVVVTNGTICEAPLRELLPLVDAMNIDLKGFTERFYQKLGGNLNTVKRAIETAAESCHIEATTLIVPGENDSPEEMEELSAWLSSVNREIPLHVTRFFPCLDMADKEPTPVRQVYRLADIARKSLVNVYVGNV